MMVSLLESLGQVSASETGQIFRDFLRGHVREMIGEVMAAEVTELCGPKHAPSSSDAYRAGSSSGRVLYEGEREKVVRPRVRQKSSDGSSYEAESGTYRVAKDPQQLQAQIVQAIVSGVSSRGIEELEPNSPGVKKPNVSRLWQDAGNKFIEQRRGKELSSITWCALMLDGTYPCKTACGGFLEAISRFLVESTWTSFKTALKAMKSWHAGHSHHGSTTGHANV